MPTIYTQKKPDRESAYVWRGRRAELKAWKDLSVGTGIEPQRKPTGLGVTISKVPTHWSSRELSELDDDDSFAMGICFACKRENFQFESTISEPWTLSGGGSGDDALISFFSLSVLPKKFFALSPSYFGIQFSVLYVGLIIYSVTWMGGGFWPMTPWEEIWMLLFLSFYMMFYFFKFIPIN